MSFLIDTDTCSAFLKQNAVAFARFTQYAGQLHVSTMVLAELFTWVFRKSAPPSRLQGLIALLNDLNVLDVDFGVARRFGEIRAVLLDRGQTVPSADLLIAATAMHHNLTLVTHNTSHYANIAGLRITDRLVP